MLAQKYVCMVKITIFSDLLRQEVFGKKIKRLYSLKFLMEKYNSDRSYEFPWDLERNFQKDTMFKITEYASLIFQNLRLRL